MAEAHEASESFVRRLIAQIERERAGGAITSQRIAERLNARGITTRKGRPWTAASVLKFLKSPGARRYGEGLSGR